MSSFTGESRWKRGEVVGIWHLAEGPAGHLFDHTINSAIIPGLCSPPVDKK